MKIYLITGAPSSGKSTYVKEHHGDNDIIFDWDNLFVAITEMPSHSEGTEGQRHVVNRLRYDLIRATKNAEEQIDNLWMIATKPSDELKEALGEYEEIHLEVDKDEAKNRADKDDNRDDKEQEHQKIDKYFDTEDKRTMSTKTDREYRAFDVRANEDEKRVTGYATTFDEPYTLYDDGEYEVREVIDPSAFDNCDMSDVILQYNHEGRVFARLSNGTLKLDIDKPNGLKIDADLGGTELGRQIYEEIKGGYTTKMSMGFKVDRSADVWTRINVDGKTIEERRINSIVKLYDTSFVSIPANPGTSIEARSIDALVNGVIDELKAERLEIERLETERKRAEIRARLMED